MNRKLLMVLLLLVGIANANAAPAAYLQVGDTLILPQLIDQFENQQPLLASTKWLIFSHDMGSSDIVTQALEQQTAQSLEAAKVQYYADISGMPGTITRFIAIPRMRDLAYAMALGYEYEQLAGLPRQAGQVTLIEISDGKIASIANTNQAQVITDTIFN